MSKNDMLAIADFKQQLTNAKQTIQVLEFQIKSGNSHKEVLTSEVLTFSAKRQKDQEIIDAVISERDDLKFLNVFMENELRLLKGQDWKFQESKLENERLRRRVSELVGELSMARGNLTELRSKRAENSRIMRSLVNEIEARKNCFSLKDLQDMEKKMSAL